jgi:glyceraldehyde 3-phosphate dehydrogenase
MSSIYFLYMVKVAINGYGRIGRTAHRIILQKHASELEVVGINVGSSTDLKGWMMLLKYDSSYGPLHGHELSVEPQEGTPGMLGNLVIDDKKIPVYSQKDASLLPWGDLGVMHPVRPIVLRLLPKSSMKLLVLKKL